MSDPRSSKFDLPPRRETVLARMPRNVKMVGTVILLALAILPPAWMHGRKLHAGTGFHEKAFPDALNTSGAGDGQGEIVKTDITAPALNDQNDRSVKLLPAPDMRLTADDALGSLPRIADDGTQPWRAYARPFDTADRRPRLAIVITGLGLSRAMTDEIIDQTPPTVTLSFSAQSPVVGAWIARARQQGHEALLQIPMEPFDYPRSDPGAGTLLTSLPNSDNLERLQNFMRRASGYVGITTLSGSRFTTDPDKMQSVLQEMHDRGLMILDARVAPHSDVTDLAREDGVPVATATQRIDTDLSPAAIAAALSDLEKTAILRGRAVGVAAATPVLLDQLQIWAKTLPQHGVALAPVSAMVR
ncbi:MAG: divergent polysaccharide deacetylase family protein [Alphaproteobacteria bacterium]|nr:divergent polysaccharide deacetylase family protein [Alphaproteobacteria bacterium]